MVFRKAQSLAHYLLFVCYLKALPSSFPDSPSKYLRPYADDASSDLISDRARK